MRQTLNIKLSQRLALTPQLQQAIRILQLSTLELQTEIQEALETNPLLEQDDSLGTAETVVVEKDGPSATDTVASSDAPVEQEFELKDSEWRDASDPAPDPAWEPGRRNNSDLPDNLLENRSAAEQNLRQHLIWQLEVSAQDARQKALAGLIIDSVGDSGHLDASLEDIRSLARAELGDDVSLDEVEQALALVQQFDPAGVASRSLQECLLIQLDQPRQEPPQHLRLAREIVSEHLSLLARQDSDALAQTLGQPAADVEAAVQLIQSLHPRPGYAISSSKTDYIRPDVTVSKENGQWKIRLNRDVIPRLKIHKPYAKLAEKPANGSKKDTDYLREHLQQAQWLIKNIDSRNDTIYRVAKVIVERQRDFLEQGESAMKPMILQDIAETLDLHESTISRATANKYMLTPRGVYELRYFFSSHVKNAEGEDCSATAVRSEIRKLIENEPPDKPISDSKLTKMLEEKGIVIARRTVAKYRESLGIPSSSKRKLTI